MEGWAPEQLAKLRQTGSVAEYRVKFLKLGNQCKKMTEETLVGLCMAGLRLELATTVNVFEPDSLRVAFRIAGRKEEELASWRTSTGRIQKGSGGVGAAGTTSPPGNASPVATGAVPGSKFPSRLPPKGFVRLTQAEMDQKRRDGRCFNCDERYTVGHQCAKGHLMLLVGNWEDEG
ncbi:unnamed protein product [Linum trigynum]|uniref:Retrotransposon gag domain-containing protein n=1 Tax=Linum trigynum TaxID=586398 RepID=A0AAV2CTI9_9ROSI